MVFRVLKNFLSKPFDQYKALKTSSKIIICFKPVFHLRKFCSESSRRQKKVEIFSTFFSSLQRKKNFSQLDFRVLAEIFSSRGIYVNGKQALLFCVIASEQFL